LAQHLDQAGIAAGRGDIGVDRIAGGCFEQQEGADDDNGQHEDRADQAATEKGECAGHGCPERLRGMTLRLSMADLTCRRCSTSSRSSSFYSASHVSAQFETAQRGLLAMLFSLSLATETKLHSATLISGRSCVTFFWNAL